MWLGVRTDPEAPPHKGNTLLLVPTSDPGCSCTLIRTLASHDTTASDYEDVRVPVSRRVGAENDGWRLVTNQLNHERVTLAAHGTMAIRALHDVQRWARETKLADGRRVADLPWVRRLLARTHTRLDALELLNWQMVAAVQDGRRARRTRCCTANWNAATARRSSSPSAAATTRSSARSFPGSAWGCPAYGASLRAWPIPDCSPPPP